ncbi:MAG: hypothetical protein AAGE59_33885, partial [Cyanobacteria bacterium P01_F01_bin.86]
MYSSYLALTLNPSPIRGAGLYPAPFLPNLGEGVGGRGPFAKLGCTQVSEPKGVVMDIAEVAKASGLPASTLRFYE